MKKILWVLMLFLSCLIVDGQSPRTVMAYPNGALAAPTNFFFTNVHAGTNMYIEFYGSNGAIRVNSTASGGGGGGGGSVSNLAVSINGSIISTAFTNLNFLGAGGLTWIGTNASGSNTVHAYITATNLFQSLSNFAYTVLTNSLYASSTNVVVVNGGGLGIGLTTNDVAGIRKLTYWITNEVTSASITNLAAVQFAFGGGTNYIKSGALITNINHYGTLTLDGGGTIANNAGNVEVSGLVIPGGAVNNVLINAGSGLAAWATSNNFAFPVASNAVRIMTNSYGVWGWSTQRLLFNFPISQFVDNTTNIAIRNGASVTNLIAYATATQPGLSLPGSGAVSNYVWACTNATTGAGEWRSFSGMVTNNGNVNSNAVVPFETNVYVGGDLGVRGTFTASNLVTQILEVQSAVAYGWSTNTNGVVLLGTNAYQFFGTNNVFTIAFNGTPLEGQAVTLMVSNTSTSDFNITLPPGVYTSDLYNTNGTVGCRATNWNWYSFVRRSPFWHLAYGVVDFTSKASESLLYSVSANLTNYAYAQGSNAMITSTNYAFSSGTNAIMISTNYTRSYSQPVVVRTNMAHASALTIYLDRDNLAFVTNGVGGDVSVTLANSVDAKFFNLRMTASGAARTIGFTLPWGLPTWISTNFTSAATNLYIPDGKTAIVSGQVWVGVGVTNVDLVGAVQP